MKKCLYLLTILAMLIQPALSFLPGASAQEGGDDPLAPAQDTLFVKPIATGTGNCSSWADACELQTALGAAISGDEIWVQAGVYKPTAANDRMATFLLINGVAIYGGFAGTETSRGQRNWMTNVTILSGDIGVVGDNSDNSYHVVTGTTAAVTAILDGFTITAGNANGASPHNRGGGMHSWQGGPTLANLIFSDNSASSCGAGMTNWVSNPTLTDVTFSNNSSLGCGGGMYNETSNPVLTRVTFTGNTAASEGGGMRNISSSPSLIDVSFKDNEAGWGAGISNQWSSPQLINVIFHNNMADNDGGAIHNYNASSPELINVTLAGNSAGRGGGMDSWDSSSPDLTNTILWGNTAGQGAQIYSAGTGPIGVSFSLVEAGCPAGVSCDHLLSVNPQFVNSAGGDLRLQLASPAIDAGSNAAVPAGVLTDLGGHARFVDVLSVPDSGSGTPPIVDMGAYETPPDVIYVDREASGANSGVSWSDALTDLQVALGWAVSGVEIWVQAGEYKPTTGSDRTATFALKTGVAVYGGFAGTETSRGQRHWVANVTTLSGDIGVVGNSSDNSYHVVTCSGVSDTAILDGFTVSGGNANSAPGNNGGGMSNLNSSPMLSNLVFISNIATGAGGGMNNDNSSPSLTGVIFIRNQAYDGGGMNNVNSSSPWLVNVTFNGNRASDGGGLFNRSSSNPTLANVTFSGNRSSADGGGMYSAGSVPILRGVTLSGNRAYDQGGGIYNNNSNVLLNNIILWGNMPAQDQLFNQSSAPVVSYSIVAGGCLSGWTCEHVFADDPLFVRSPSPGADGQWGTPDDDYGDLRLQITSPAIDAGNNAVVPSGVLTDLLGYPRFIDIASVADTGFGTPPIVDMGAYEAQIMLYLPVVNK